MQLPRTRGACTASPPNRKRISRRLRVIDDPSPPNQLSPEPDDDYLITLAGAAGADCLVTDDHDLTGPADPTPPVLTPRRFRHRLTEASGA